MLFQRAVEAAAQSHARAQYPNESCGVVRDGVYLPLPNVAADPRETFQLPAAIGYQAVIHSHCAPHHQAGPSAADMRGQVETAVPWGIVHTDGKDASAVLWWGDFRLDEPMLGQSYLWGVNDCWSLIRKWYWQNRTTKLPEIPRDEQAFHSGADMMLANMAAAGFYEIAERNVRTGDVVFLKIRSAIPNHCALLAEGGMLLHHLPGRLSCRDHIWVRHITNWLRHEG